MIADVAKVRSHRYRLKVPAGSYWMFAATTPFRGKAGVDRLSGKVVGPQGQAEEGAGLDAQAQASEGAPAAFVNVKYPAVWVQHFPVSGVAEYGPLRKGIADMLITDISAAARGRVRGQGRRAREARRSCSRSRLFANPGKLPSTDRMIAHNREVGGSWP